MMYKSTFTQLTIRKFAEIKLIYKMQDLVLYSRLRSRPMASKLSRLGSRMIIPTGDDFVSDIYKSGYLYKTKALRAYVVHRFGRVRETGLEKGLSCQLGHQQRRFGDDDLSGIVVTPRDSFGERACLDLMYSELSSPHVVDKFGFELCCA